MLNQKTKVDIDKIRNLRINARVNQERLGGVIGVSTNQYGKKELGKAKFFADDIAAMADFYGVDPGFFYTHG
jgi:transcriptional regulator with XRE-family HTH domain